MQPIYTARTSQHLQHLAPLPQFKTSTKYKNMMVDIETGAHTSTITPEVEKWTANIQDRAQNASLSSEEKLWKRASIYKVPAFVRDLNPKAFTPELVSFGPYHHNEGELKLMEVHKERALVHFVRRTGKTLDEFVTKVGSVLHVLQDSYYLLDDKWRNDRDGFLKLMIMDGCFMLEVLHFAERNGEDYSSTDPYFSQHGIHHKMPYIRRDMLIIENQLPLLLLTALVAVGNLPITEDIDTYIHKLVLNFLTGDIDGQVEPMSLKNHSLDLYRHSVLSPAPTTTQTKQPVSAQKQTSLSVIRSADELREAGVRFRKSKTKSYKDIDFDPKSGILNLPQLIVDDATECTLLNLVAFENLQANLDHHVTSYVCFMDEIIDSPRDVTWLQRKGIIQNSLGSSKAVSELFNRISKELTTDPESRLIKVRQLLDDYCQKKWNKWQANLLHTYFRNPWSACSLVAAVFVILLTICQTVFAILQYCQPSSD